MASLPDNDEPDDPYAGSGKQNSLEDLVKPADWSEDKNFGTLSIDDSCVSADITYPTDLMMLNESRASTERIIDDLCSHILVGVFTNYAAIKRLVGSQLLEQQEE